MVNIDWGKCFETITTDNGHLQLLKVEFFDDGMYLIYNMISFDNVVRFTISRKRANVFCKTDKPVHTYSAKIIADFMDYLHSNLIKWSFNGWSEYLINKKRGPDDNV